MSKNNQCAGSYSVNGYTRADGTQVSGYIRTCGAAHNSTDSLSSQESKKEKIIRKEDIDREKMQRRADILYPAAAEKNKEENSKSEDKSNWLMPCEGLISSDYGKRKSPTTGASSDHKGIDIKVPIGTSVKAIADGKVVSVGPARGYGLWVRLDHGEINGKIVTSEYGHISKGTVVIGQKVKRGDEIAKSGNTGVGTGPHLHLTIREDGIPETPWKYIKK